MTVEILDLGADYFVRRIVVVMLKMSRCCRSFQPTYIPTSGRHPVHLEQLTVLPDPPVYDLLTKSHRSFPRSRSCRATGLRNAGKRLVAGRDQPSLFK
jgi:hypothetical protein